MNTKPQSETALYAGIKNKEIVKLLKSLERMPLYLAEKELRYYADREFRRLVFEEACLQAGLIKPSTEKNE